MPLDQCITQQWLRVYMGLIFSLLQLANLIGAIWHTAECNAHVMGSLLISPLKSPFTMHTLTFFLIMEDFIQKWFHFALAW